MTKEDTTQILQAASGLLSLTEEDNVPNQKHGDNEGRKRNEEREHHVEENGQMTVFPEKTVLSEKFFRLDEKRLCLKMQRKTFPGPQIGLKRGVKRVRFENVELLKPCRKETLLSPKSPSIGKETLLSPTSPSISKVELRDDRNTVHSANCVRLLKVLNATNELPATLPRPPPFVANTLRHHHHRASSYIPVGLAGTYTTAASAIINAAIGVLERSEQELDLMVPNPKRSKLMVESKVAGVRHAHPSQVVASTVHDKITLSSVKRASAA